ncbi:MAG TPA: hypothetical protein VFK40_01280, partial [Nitrososphaeraceae archaeon]|nr:hypothetical protein [Nitrososphaeraceae archaeon]
IIFIASILSFTIMFGTYTYAQFDKIMDKQQTTSKVSVKETETVNMTDEMKFLCIKLDVSGSIDQMKDKDQQAECKRFLHLTSIQELRELIDKYVEDN